MYRICTMSVLVTEGRSMKPLRLVVVGVGSSAG